MKFAARLFVLALSGMFAAGSAQADQIAAADLQILGVGLKVITISAVTGLDIPAAIQTEFGGKQNDEAQVVEGLLAVGELSGPGIDVPIRLETAPGHKFQVPGLSREGVYFLQNIRLMKGSDFLQTATPSIATITVSNVLQTSVRVKQLTPEDLRARGISIDARNYDVFEYTFSFLVNGQLVEIPFPVVVDPRTHQVIQLPEVTPYHLPPITQVIPPRWEPPQVETFELGAEGELPPAPADDQGPKTAAARPSIPAALIIPNSLAVLHQFFAVTLMVTNGAPAGSTVTLDSVTALIRSPAPLRTIKSLPSVAFNQPVPIVDATTGVTFLVAQARGDAEWTMEGLQPGTHTVEVEVRATYKSPGQVDFPLKGTVRASVVIHDPRFNVTFSHPDTVRKDIEYSTFSFITNMSGSVQNIKVTNGLPACADSPGSNVCRVDGTPASTDLSLPPGEMRMVEYKLKPGITGHVFATAGSVSDDAISAQVELHMGVSESGIPLSPATLIMPYYSQFVSQSMVSANLQLLGLGYSLATAPLTASLAAHPHVIRSDVFQRATDIARAGQRVFLGESMRDSLSHMLLDLLGNSLELREWDDLRRQEKSGRIAAASIASEIQTSFGGASLADFASHFASVTAWRAPYLLAVTSAGNLSVREVTSGARLDVPSEAASGWVRQIPSGELNTFQSGQLAVVGRWSGSYEVTVTPAVDGPFTMEVVLPATADGSVLCAYFTATGSAGKPLTAVIRRGATSLELRDSLGGIVAMASSINPVSPESIQILGARQDLNLDPAGHKVSILWNRPVTLATGDDLLKKLAAQISLNKDGVSYQGPRPMSAAALQEGGRVANVTFDHSLSLNATYSMTVGSLVDPLNGSPVTFPTALVPVIDNDRPGGIIFGHVYKGDNTPIAGAEVRLFLEENAGPPQYDSSRTGDGSFLFEFVPRDIDNKLPGTYKLEAVTEDLKSTSVLGAVRLPGRVHFVNLVFLGRGSAEGYVRYDNGQVVANAEVVVGSTLFDQFRKTTADAGGHYTIDDLPVGPLTFIATDADGNITYAAAEIKTPGQRLLQNLSIYRRPFPGTATIRGVVRRSDTNAVVAGAHVGVYSQGYGLIDGFTDTTGAFEFLKVPTGFVTVLASEWSLSREAVSLDFDLAANETRDLTLTLNVHPAEALVVIEGDVTREDPLHPGDANFYQKVAGALVKIEKAQTVTADGNGHFVYPSIPVSFAGKNIQGYDPTTKRTATTVLPSPLDPSRTNLAPIFISTASGYGEGTIRVRLLNAAGFPVTGFNVFVPGYPPYPPPMPLESLPNGIYQLKHVAVGSTTPIWAVGGGSPPYGDQFANGTVKVEFNGHIAALTLRLPGAGTVRAKLTGDIDVIGDVSLTYQAWDVADQMLEPKTVTASTSNQGIAGYASFSGVPALQSFLVASQHPVYGYASQSGRLGFDGDVQSITLQLNKLSTVRGVVYAIDGRTPVAGAAVHIEDGRQNSGIYTSLPDGSFVFFNVPAAVGFRVIAEVTQDGTYRTGVVSGSTTPLGGPVTGVSVILRTQGGIDGRIVYAGYKKYDPLNPANNVVDDTPNDLSDNAPVPLAKFVLRELDFPYRSFGTTADPSTADIAGRFTINNVFTGALRVSASDPGNQENRGTFAGSINLEGERITAYIGIGVEGFGPVTVRVLDPNAQNAPVLNSEVTLIRNNSRFDLATTDATGTVRFEQVPVVGAYYVSAYSKALGKSGSSPNFNVIAVTGAQVDVVLQFSGKVNGKFSDPEANGRGVPGAPVTLTEQTFQTRASTDVDGAFIFDGVREGIFKLDAKDTLSNRRATASRQLTQADPNPFVSLLLEPTETLFVSIYLPNDSGGNSNILAPLVNIEVRQRDDDFLRALQGNAFQMPGLFRNERYSVYVQEIGGAAREIRTTATFPQGSASDPLKLVWQAYGAVEVHVVQGVLPAANAKVSVFGSGKSATVYTDASGIALATGIPLGVAYVNVLSVDGAFSGSANTTLTSQSNPAVVSITLGAFAGVTGLVDAELGGPSVGTRVVAAFAGRILEGFTDATGRFTFQGIPTGSHVDLTYIGPDDTTVGARQAVNIGLGDASRIIEVPRVKLDATPPQVASMFPADGASGVSPDSAMQIVFTETIGAGYINSNYIQLVPADSSTPVAVSYSSTPNANGTFTVTMTPPPAPPGQRFPLQSNTLYRIIISGEIRDLTGNKLPAARGSSFTTADYVEPHVVKVIPSTAIPLQPATTFEFRFNKPIDPAPWQPGGAGQFHLYKISTAGPGGTIITEKPGRAFVDPATNLSLFFAPNDPIEQESFYRVVFSGIVDTHGNVLGLQTYHFFSYDLVKPFVIPVSPVPATFPLISGVEYTLGVDIRNADANGSTATDVAKVDYFRVDGATATYIFTASSLPWSYRFVAPEAPPAGSTLTLRAVATDLSGNESAPGTITWQVKPNQAPQNVTITLVPPDAIYPGNHAFVSVKFEDEGTLATVQVDAQATQTDGSAYTKSQVKTLTRAKVDDAWPDAGFDFDLPAILKQGTRVTFNATVTDVRGLKGTASAGLDLSIDTIAPQALALTPAPQTHYNIGQKFQIVAVIKDMETGASEVTFSFDNQSIRVSVPSPQATLSGDHTWTFNSGLITVPAKNVDTTIPILITAKDYNNNVVTKSTEVIYNGVNDPSVPKGAWLCPIEKAVYPASSTFNIKLQARATDDIAVTGVKFTVPGVASPIIATRVGTSDVYEATTPLTTGAAGTSLTLTATISDANPDHDIAMTIPVDVVAVDITVDDRIQAITPADIPNYQGKSILVRGANGRLIPHAAIALKNLIVLDGARVDTLSTTTTGEQRLDLTISDRLYVDCASSIDVSSRGYVGGWGVNGDGSGTKNEDNRGRTAGNTVSGGPTPGASASYGGLGGQQGSGLTNAVYGSISNPFDLGTGGAGSAGCCSAGAAGGGAIKLRGGIFAIAGAIRADGGNGIGASEAGSGGSVNAQGSQTIIGPSARITANGGDDDGSQNNSRGAGGGRVAIDASDRFDVESVGLQIQARGGRNNSSESPVFLDGGAGTIFVRRPGQTLGELFASSLDERFAQSTHLTRPTPLSGVLRFDRFTLGARALVRADASLEIGGVVDTKSAATIDPTAVLILNGEVPTLTTTTTPVASSALIQTSALSLTYTANSAAGIGAVTLAFSPVTPSRVDSYFDYRVSATPSPAVQFTVPFDAAVAPSTLTISATDRAERGASLPPYSFTIVANTPPVIDQFDPAPLSLYPGHSVSTNVSAHDDLKITKLTFTSTIGTGTPANQAIFPNTPAITNQTFNVAIPIDTPGGQTLKLDVAVEDGFPGRTATTQTKNVSILKDMNPPSVTITAPVNNALFNEGTGNTIQVRATITDADVGVKDVFLQIGTEPSVAMTKSGSEYIATVPVPSVDGTDIVTKPLTVTARDYENNAAAPSINIQIKPLNDPNAPVISWVCTTTGAMYPAGYGVKLRVFALGNNTGNPSNGIQKVEMFVDNSPTPLPATAVPGLTNYYEATYTIASDAVAGTVIGVRAVATNVAGSTDGASTSFTIVTGQKITADKTITATDTTYDNQTVIVQSGTTTIAGQHTFDKLIVLDGAKVTHAFTDATTIQRLNFVATSNVFVSCAGSIDVSTRGATGSSNGTAYTYDRATDKPTLTGGATNFSAGSHGGQGGVWTGNVPPAYGSPFDPNTPGGAGASGSGTSCSPCRGGGGVARIRTSALVIDGKILANGEASNSSGAGGSIRIDATTITGTGEIHADGGLNTGAASGGGGRIAIYYNTLSIPAAKITAAALQANTPSNIGAPGTIYLRQNDTSGAKVSDELIIDNLGLSTPVSTVITTAGAGTVSAVSGNVVTLSAAVPFDIEGTWIEFLSASGSVISSYEITSRTATTVTLRLGTSETAPNTSSGNAYRGMARVDRMTSRGLAIFESSGATASTFTGAASSLFRFTNVNAIADATLQTATMEVNNGTFSAPNLTLAGSTLTHARATATNINRLNVSVGGALNIDAASAIDVSTRGITGSASGPAYTYDRATDKPTLTGGATNFSAGSHGGQGGVWTGNVPPAYGSPFDPNTPGGAGSSGSGTTCTPCRSGGGVARIKAGTLQLDGKILANGEASNSSGAGGSIRIDATSIAGAGEIHADGGLNTGSASGGGGRIAIYYNTLSIPAAKITAASLQANTPNNVGAPGTIYLRQNDVSGAKVFDELVADNLARSTNVTTVVVTAGSGTVTAVNGNVVTLSSAVPFDIEGTWIEFLDATGNVTSSYEITARTATTVTLRIGSGETIANVTVGASYRGMLNVSRATSRGLAVLEGSGVIAGSFTTSGSGLIRFTDLHSNGDITLQGATLEVNGSLSAANLSLLQSSTLTQRGATATTFNRLNINLTGTLTIDSTSSIDVSLRGLTGSVNGTAYTFDRATGTPTLTGGATSFSAGGHGGQGGVWSGNVPPAFGSLFDPNEPGGAGSSGSGTTCMPCRSGGGVVRIKAASLQIDGKILANGEASNSSGAGGSIRIDATTIAGAGEIHADGGVNTGAASGSGGRIAIYFNTLSIPAAKITAVALQANTPGNVGAPGTIYLKGTANTYGDLIVDNLGRTTPQSTSLTSVGYSKVTDFGADFVKDSNAQFSAPDQLRGVRVVVNYDRTKNWPILSNDKTTLRLDVSGQALVAQAGQPLRGLYRFDSVKLRNAKLDVIDLLESTATIDKDAASSIIGNNQAPPLLVSNLITLQTTPTGAAALGSAGAVTDLDTPITLFATNTATGNVYPNTANPDGSFAIAVQGNTGDAITIKARDANVYPLESPTLALGNLQSGTPVPSQVNKSAWTADASFLPRTLSRDGGYLAVASYPWNGSGSSATLVILSITDPSHPTLVRALNPGAGVIRDVVVSNGWAYGGGDRFFTLNLSDPSATAIFPAGDSCGSDASVALLGGYAFTTMADCYGDGEINIYDVSTPSAPRYIRTQGFGYGGFQFTDVLALGNDYIVALSNNKSGGVGHDVVVLDRRDLSNLKKVADIDIPNFDAFRGTMVGTTLYVVSQSTAQLALVDLSNPASPVVIGTTTIPAPAGGVAVIGSDAFAAASASGLVTLNVANPAAPAVVGTTSVSGNAFDATVIGAYVYVANELGIALVPAQVAPQVTLSRISMNLSGTTVTVTGAPQSVTGNMPITVEVMNKASGVKTGVSVQSDGSFTAALTASAGAPMTIKATDLFGRVTGPLSLGTAPFGSQTHLTVITTAMTDANFLARNVATAGNDLAVGSYGGSDKIVLFDVTDRANPVYKRTVPTGAGTVRDMAIVNGYLIFGADRLGTLKLSDPAATPVFPVGDSCGSDLVMEIIGGYAFTAMADCYGDGEINVYDVSNPAAPRYLRSQGFGYGGFNFTGLAALGTDYIVAVSNIKSGGVGHDVVVIDRRDVYNMKKVADIDIPNFDAFHAKAIGTTLYVAGVDGGLAVVDLSNPASQNPPITILRTPGYPRSVDAIGAMLAVADGSAGATFVDISSPMAPAILGNQPTGGSAWECAFNGATLYIVNEQGLAVIDSLATAPLIDRSLITTASTGGGTTATVTGPAKAILGLAPVTIELRNTTTSASISGLAVAADGSFNNVITGSPGDALTIKATDSVGRTSGPLSLGTVPFGSQTHSVVITTAMSDVNFLARNVATSGNYLAVGSYPTAAGGASDKIVLFDVTDRANPVYKRTVLTGAGYLRDMAVVNGYLIFTADRLGTLNLSDPISTPVFPVGDACGSDLAMEIIGGYAFTAMADCYGDGEINVYDVSTPSAPRYLRSQGFGYGGFNFTGLAALGTDYLVAVSNIHSGGVGHDVVVIDRRDVYNMKKVADFDIPNFDAFRAKAIGTTLYVAGVDGGLAVVDLSNPVSPNPPTTILHTPGYPRSVDAVGAMLGVADGSAGATFVDISSPTLPTVLGNQSTGGTAWECAFNGAALYIVNELTLAVIDNLGTPPLIDRNLITTSSNGATTATVAGSAKAILGLAPVRIELRNTTTGTSISGITTAGDGSFTGNITAVSGDALTIKATDGAGRASGPLSLGTVPFGLQMRHVAISTAMSDANFLARNIAADGNDLVVGGYPVAGVGSDKVVVFDVSTPGNPIYKRTVASTAGAVRDVAVSNGWAVIAADRLETLNLADPNSTPISASGDPCGSDLAVELSGGYAFTVMADCYGDGEINIYDVSTPSSPRYIRTQAFGYGGFNFTGLAAVGTDYLVAISNLKSGGVGHDVVVLDRRDINNLKRIADYDIPNFDGFHAKAIGNMLYVAGVDGGVAIVDLSNPAAPVLVTTVSSAGAARAIETAGSTLAVANGSSGVTFIDVTSSTAPRVVGSQPVAGSAWDVALSRGAMYVATEVGVTAVSNVATPPMLKESLLTVTPAAATTTVSGSAQTLTGISPITVQITNRVTNATSTNATVNGDGSFAATVVAQPGHALKLSASDVSGRVTTRNVVQTFGSTTTSVANQSVAGDAAYRARRVASDGNVTVVSTGSLYGTGLAASGKLLFRQPNASEPVSIVSPADGGIYDVQISGGYAYVAGDRLVSVGLSDLVAHQPNGDPCGSDGAVAVSGQYAFTVMQNCYGDGEINIYDVSTPTAPRYIRSQGVGGNFIYQGIVAMGSSYLIALSPDRPGGVGRDITVIDRTNINSLTKIGELEIANFDALDAAIDGSTLYVAGGDGGVAVVDMTNPFSPQLKSTIRSAGMVRAVAVSGPNQFVFADGAGVTFVDVTDKNNPIVIGRQALPGNVIDVSVVAKTLYVAAENYFHMILRP